MVVLSVGKVHEPCKKTAEPIKMSCIGDSGGLKEPYITWGCTSPRGTGNWEGEVAAHCKV